MKRLKPQDSRRQITEKTSVEGVVFAEKTFVRSVSADLNQMIATVARIFFKLPDVEVEQKDPSLTDKAFKYQ